LTHLLDAGLAGRAIVSVQMPIVLSDDTEPEPDVQILRRWYGNFGIGHSIGYYRRTTHSFAYWRG